MSLSMKNLIRTIPEKWLEKEKGGKSKEIVLLENQNYVGAAKKNNRSARHDQLFCCIPEKSRSQEKAPRKDKKTNSDHPKNWWNNIKRHETIESRQNSNHTCEKYRISVIRIIHPQPQSHKEKKRKRNNHSIVHISPEKIPKEIEKCCPRKT